MPNSSYINRILRQVQENINLRLFINMKTISKIRLVLAGVLLGSATMLANSTKPVETNTTYHCHHKAQYYAIRADLEDGKITIEQAQRRWQKALKELNRKEEAK